MMGDREMKTQSKEENPFESMKTIISSGAENPPFIEFRTRFSLSESEVKVVWMTCPEFQEGFCRERITASKHRGGSVYGNKHWLSRRYKLSEQELEAIFRDIWNNPKEKTSSKFLAILSSERIAESQCTQNAKMELRALKIKYGNEN